jgi:hypothetical protein
MKNIVLIMLLTVVSLGCTNKEVPQTREPMPGTSADPMPMPVPTPESVAPSPTPQEPSTEGSSPAPMQEVQGAESAPNL